MREEQRDLAVAEPKNFVGQALLVRASIGSQQDHRFVAPLQRLGGLGNETSDRQAITLREVAHVHPAIRPQQSVLAGRTNRSARRELDSKDRARAFLPHAIGARAMQALLRVDGPHFRRAADELAHGNAAPVGQDHPGVSRDAFAQIRHHRPLVRPLLERAIELRQGHHGDLQLLRQSLERA